MTNIQKERWVELCEKIAEEKNPQKMIELTRELNKILTDRVKFAAQEHLILDFTQGVFDVNTNS